VEKETLKAPLKELNEAAAFSAQMGQNDTQHNPVVPLTSVLPVADAAVKPCTPGRSHEQVATLPLIL
jgi:hypothetical protein